VGRPGRGGIDRGRRQRSTPRLREVEKEAATLPVGAAGSLLQLLPPPLRGRVGVGGGSKGFGFKERAQMLDKDSRLSHGEMQGR
jgi:hypothetical protein